MRNGLTRLCRVFRCLEPAFAGGRHIVGAMRPGVQLPTVSLLAQDDEDITNTAGSANARVSPKPYSDNRAYGHGMSRGASHLTPIPLGDLGTSIVG